jgi:hypothetical protein
MSLREKMQGHGNDPAYPYTLSHASSFFPVQKTIVAENIIFLHLLQSVISTPLVNGCDRVMAF